jgi:hypothetical protein
VDGSQLEEEQSGIEWLTNTSLAGVASFWAPGIDVLYSQNWVKHGGILERRRTLNTSLRHNGGAP